MNYEEAYQEDTLTSDELFAAKKNEFRIEWNYGRRSLMELHENVPLQQFSTMRLGGEARYLAKVESESDVTKMVAWAQRLKLPIIMIGQGSNIIWKDEGFEGLVMVNAVEGFELNQIDDFTALLTVGAGENWDQVVGRSVQMGYSGLELLSLIPGLTGATPVQNVGAYGQEVKNILKSVHAYDLKSHKFVDINNKDCQFGYRTSRFKTSDRGRFLITSVTFELTTESPTPPFYGSLQNYLDAHGIKDYSVQVLRDAVVQIRSQKLPDPNDIANNGSFFANPVIDKDAFKKLHSQYPEIVSWPTSDGRVKLSAAWLLETAGFKDYHDTQTGMATWPKHSLVFVNEYAKHTHELIAFRDKIMAAVKTKFDVDLEQEPELLP